MNPSIPSIPQQQQQQHHRQRHYQQQLPPHYYDPQQQLPVAAATTTLDPEFLQRLQNQVDFYFSTENLSRDDYLRNILVQNYGAVAIEFIATFPMIARIFAVWGWPPSGTAHHPETWVVLRHAVGLCSRTVWISEDGFYFLHPDFFQRVVVGVGPQQFQQQQPAEQQQQPPLVPSQQQQQQQPPVVQPEQQLQQPAEQPPPQVPPQPPVVQPEQEQQEVAVIPPDDAPDEPVEQSSNSHLIPPDSSDDCDDDDDDLPREHWFVDKKNGNEDDGTVSATVSPTSFATSCAESASVRGGGGENKLLLPVENTVCVGSVPTNMTFQKFIEWLGIRQPQHKKKKRNKKKQHACDVPIPQPLQLHQDDPSTWRLVFRSHQEADEAAKLLYHRRCYNKQRVSVRLSSNSEPPPKFVQGPPGRQHYAPPQHHAQQPLYYLPQYVAPPSPHSPRQYHPVAMVNHHPSAVVAAPPMMEYPQHPSPVAQPLNYAAPYPVMQGYVALPSPPIGGMVPPVLLSVGTTPPTTPRASNNKPFPEMVSVPNTMTDQKPPPPPPPFMGEENSVNVPEAQHVARRFMKRSDKKKKMKKKDAKGHDSSSEEEEPAPLQKKKKNNDESAATLPESFPPLQHGSNSSATTSKPTTPPRASTNYAKVLMESPPADPSCIFATMSLHDNNLDKWKKVEGEQ